MKNTRFFGLAVMIVCTAAGMLFVLARRAEAKGLERICHLYGESNAGNYEQTQVCDLPEGFRLDRSYQQEDFRCCGGGATSYIQSSKEIPQGIRIETDGGHYWAVPKAPSLQPLKMDDDDRVLQWRVLVPMYCGPNPPVGCNIKVDVYAARR